MIKNRSRICHLIERIDRLIDAPIITTNTKRIRAARMELDRLYSEEEHFWAQRSRITWLKEGDRNTRFFHVRASHCRKKNWIEGIKNENGEWVEGTREVCLVARHYFLSLFRTEVSLDSDSFLNQIQECITAEMNAELVREVFDAKIMEAFR